MHKKFLGIWSDLLLCNYLVQDFNTNTLWQCFETNLIIACEGFILIMHSSVENVLCKFIDLVKSSKIEDLKKDLCIGYISLIWLSPTLEIIIKEGKDARNNFYGAYIQENGTYKNTLTSNKLYHIIRKDLPENITLSLWFPWTI